MSPGALSCRLELRRDAVRRAGLNGIDFVELDDDRTHLCLRFLGDAPEDVRVENVVIEGGERIRDVRVTGVRVTPSADPELDDCLEVAVDRPGDSSTYTLRLVEARDGRPTGTPLHGFDPRYAAVDFSFQAGCPSDLDCAVEPECEPAEEPVLDYLARDYQAFRQLILDRLALVLPDWQERHAPDLYLALVEVLAYAGDHLSYHQDAVATEAYLDTARHRISVRRHARLVDYLMHEGCNARTWVRVETDTDLDLDRSGVSFVTGPPSDGPGPLLPAERVEALEREGALVFEPVALAAADETVRLRRAHGRIGLYAWGDRECCLAAGTTGATLIDLASAPEDLREAGPEPGELADPVRALDLRPGDVLILEEVKGPVTGQEGDADPAHRHAVRLTAVTPTEDRLFTVPAPGSGTGSVPGASPESESAGDSQPGSEPGPGSESGSESSQGGRMPLPLLEVRWAPEDALPFPLCLSSLGGAPECAPIQDVSVARGNVLLVDHGRSVGPEGVGTVAAGPTVPLCEEEGRPAEVTARPERFAPTLPMGPLTFAEPVAAHAPASALLAQDPRLALPALALEAVPEHPSHRANPTWEIRRDLLASGPSDQHAVVEMDEDGVGHLRFGDGEAGALPAAGLTFTATRYRVGSGPAANVGAGTVSRLAVGPGIAEGVNVLVTNPMPAVGGTDPEPVALVRELAPFAFRAEPARAVVAEDYAAVAGRDARVQRAAAELRWTGSWYRMNVAVDPRGGADAPEDLLEAVRQELYPFRRIGHDLEVLTATAVPLDLEVEVCVAPEYLRAHVQAEVLRVLGAGRLPGGRLGLFHPDRLTFGQSVLVSAIVAAVQAVPGVRSATVTRLQRLGERPNGELDAGLLRLGPTEVARLDDDPSFPEHGRLRLTMRGGR